jgi:hypothetical protein
VGFDTERAKRMAPIGIAISLALIALFAFIFKVRGWDPLLEFLGGEASFRITSSAFVAPIAILFLLLILVVAIARLFSAHQFAAKVEIPLAWLSIATIIAIPVLSIGGSILQHGLLPRYGYHYCNLLSGNPTVWFNDWVRKPEWCVRGKTHDWVREQAAKAQNDSAN